MAIINLPVAASATGVNVPQGGFVQRIYQGNDVVVNVDLIATVNGTEIPVIPRAAIPSTSTIDNGAAIAYNILLNV